MTKVFCVAMTLWVVSLSALAEQRLATVPLGMAAETLAGEGSRAIAYSVTAEAATPLRTVAEVSAPGITSPVYALKGQVRYENVTGQAYLQLDSTFENKGTFFTKGLADTGPLQKIAGSSDWRAFTLPFYANRGDQAEGDALRPSKLTLSVHLPGTGTVYLRDVALYQYAEGENPLPIDDAWFIDRIAIFVSAIGGTLLGLWGAVVGVLVSQGRARGFVIGSANALIVVGAVCLVLGAAAWMLGQPHAVVFPLVLTGALLVIVVGMLRRTVPRRYEALELAKMRAMDA